jgi:hypothetical protein
MNGFLLFRLVDRGLRSAARARRPERGSWVVVSR